MRPRSTAVVLALATLLTLASSAIGGRVTVNYADIEGCTAGCEVAAAGWPFPFLADYPGLSPSGKTSLIEAFFGGDHVLATSLVATWLAWFAAVGVLAWLMGRRREPKKRRRL